MNTLEESRDLSRHTPGEILSEIFLHCTTNNTIDTLLLLTQTCSRWRTIAISTPRLWSRLRININQRSAESQSALVSTWLARSGSCLLMIFLFWEEDESPSFFNHPVLEVLARRSHYWQEMLFYMPLPAFQSLASIEGNLPMLTKLSIGADAFEADQRDIHGRNQWGMFKFAPKLRSFEAVNIPPLAFQIPWSQLYTIPIIVVAPDKCLQILRESRNLRQANFIYDKEAGALDITPLQHDHLLELNILTRPHSERVVLDSLLQNLILPRLQLLEIRNLRSLEGRTFRLFLSRIGSLKTLLLQGVELSDEEMITALRTLPSLKTLVLIEKPPSVRKTVTNHLLNKMTLNTGLDENSLVPQLERIHFEIDEQVGESFLGMVQSRRRARDGIVHLRRVTVMAYGRFLPSVTDGLDELRGEGLVVEVLPGPNLPRG